jgi:hypothetical protein
MRVVTVEEVEKHIDATNPHIGPRNAWDLAIPKDWRLCQWSYDEVNIEDLPLLMVASKEDVKAFATRKIREGKPFPAIIIIGKPPDAVVVDGSHRLAAARLLGNTTIDAYIGVYPPHGHRP